MTFRGKHAPMNQPRHLFEQVICIGQSRHCVCRAGLSVMGAVSALLQAGWTCAGAGGGAASHGLVAGVCAGCAAGAQALGLDWSGGAATEGAGRFCAVCVAAVHQLAGLCVGGAEPACGRCESGLLHPAAGQCGTGFCLSARAAPTRPMAGGGGGGQRGVVADAANRPPAVDCAGAGFEFWVLWPAAQGGQTGRTGRVDA